MGDNSGPPVSTWRSSGRVIRLLVVVGTLVVVVLAALMARTLTTMGDATERYQQAAFAISDMAAVQRDLLALALELEQLDADADHIELRLRAGQLRRQWAIAATASAADAGTSAAQSPADHSQARLAEEMDAVLTAVAAHLADAHHPLAPHDPLIEAILQLERDVDEELERREAAHLDTFRDALQSRAEGQWRILAALAALLVSSAGLSILGARTIRRSITAARAEILGMEQRHRDLVTQVREGIVEIDATGRLALVNPAWTRITGLSAEESLGRALSDLLQPSDEESIAALRLASAGNNPDGPDEIEVLVRLPCGVERWGDLGLSRRADGGWAGLLMDVSDEVAARRELHAQATRDSLTGLANRSALVDYIERALAASGRYHSNVGLIFIDLDRFKLVNDSMGHHAGDRLLSEIAARLRTTSRAGDIAARLGGDEFVVLVEGLPQDAVEAMTVCRALADRIATTIAKPVQLEGREVSVTASIGLSLAGRGQSADGLLAQGDTAMYRAKELGKSRIEVFDDVLRARVRTRVDVEHHLHNAVAHDQLRLWLQPVVDIASGGVVGGEALLRWQHPERGLIPPGEFLSVAEDTGAIVEIGRWMIGEACRTAHSWPAELGELDIAVNVSAAQLMRSDLRHTVLHALADVGLPARRLVLEITESVYLTAGQDVVEQLEDLSRAGVRLAMDDFGTGYSSLSSLRSLPIDVVKLDQSFVAGLGRDLDDTTIISSVIELGATMGLHTVAEGVETEEQLRLLSELGCASAQGYLFAKPVPAEEFADVLRTLPSPPRLRIARETA